MRFKYLHLKKSIANEQGMVLVLALIMLCLMSIIGIAASKTSSIETLLASAERDQKEAFYSAEAGIEYTRGMFKTIFLTHNTDKILAGQTPDWDFALDGSEQSAAIDTSYDGGVTWVVNRAIGNRYVYSVTVWNNTDSGSATNDTDGVIFIRAEATGTPGGKAIIELSVQGSASGVETVSGYSGQEGGGFGKSYSSEDAEAITDFSTQIT